MSADSLARFSDTLRRLHDARRPLYQGVIDDVSQWAATGAAYVSVPVAGFSKQMIYRDGPTPYVGMPVQFARMGGDQTAEWLVLQPPAGQVLYMVLHGTSRGTHDLIGTPIAVNITDPEFWIVATYDPATGVWAKLCDHPYQMPAANRLQYRAELRYINGRFWTWAHKDASGAYGPDLFFLEDNAWWSADAVTWTPVDLPQVEKIEEGAPLGGVAIMYAIADGGRRVSVSEDGGDTWATVREDLTGALHFHALAPDPLDPDTCAARVKSTGAGYYLTTDRFATLGPAMLPLNTNNDELGTHKTNVVRTAGGDATVASAMTTFGGGGAVAPGIGRQADPFSPGGTIPFVAQPYPNIVSEWSLARVGGRLYAFGRFAWYEPGTPNPTLSASDDDGQTWAGDCATDLALWLKDEDGTAYDLGIGAVAEPDTGDLYAAVDCRLAGAYWRDAWDTAQTAVIGYQPKLLRKSGATWEDATGTLYTDIATAGERYAIYREAMVAAPGAP